MPTILHLVSGHQVAVAETPKEVHDVLSEDRQRGEREHGEPFSMFKHPDGSEGHVYVAPTAVTHFEEG